MYRLNPKVGLLTLCSLLVVMFLPSVRAEDLGAGAETTSTPQVMVYFHPVQEHMEGPNPYLKRSFANIGAIGVLVSPAAWGIGLAIEFARIYDAALNNFYIKEPLTELESFDFDFETEMTRRLDELDRDAYWQMVDIKEFDFVGKQENRSKRIFRTTDARYVLYVKALYFVSPDLAQIRALLTVTLYQRTNHESIVDRMMSRNYEYLSQSKGEVMRPWHKGEKEEVISKLEEMYETSIADEPDNASNLASERDDIIDQIRKRDVIPPFIAIAEGWPGHTMEQELQVAADAVFDMLYADLHDISPGFEKTGKKLRFIALDLAGNPKKYKGYKVETAGPNTIYRTRKGDLYSVPPL